MAASTANRFTFSVKPVDYSLTAGTNIPAPLDSPPHSPAGSLARPPTPGGGPLTSHPTTPDDMPGAFPPTPEPEEEAITKLSTSTSATNAKQDRTDSFRTPMSPASAGVTNHTSSPEPQRRPSGGRKLLSLSSLRSSFNSSRTSLNLPRASIDGQPNQQYHQYNSLKRPSSPSIASTTASYQPPFQQRPELKSKKSGSWFRRKSEMFMMNGDSTLDAVDENQRPDTRESKRLKESEPAPLLPEVGALRGGRLGAGEIGWDESVFGR